MVLASPQNAPDPDRKRQPVQLATDLEKALQMTGTRDVSAFQRLYTLTAPRLYGICVRICSDRKAAEAVLTTVYLMVWRDASNWQPGRTDALTWLSTIARHCAIDWRRSPDNAPITPASAALSDALAQPPEVDVKRRVAARCEPAKHGIESLALHEQAVIRAAYSDGCTYAEISADLGVPLDTLKSWARNGLVALRADRLRKEGDRPY